MEPIGQFFNGPAQTAPLTPSLSSEDFLKIVSANLQ
jgi:hypothetical protein